jgi:RimJ/RimL family protein N-acetyltransferase
MLFDDETPIGITGVAVDRDDPSKRTAIFWGSWLKPDYRGRGLSKLMYEKRIEWARAHATVRRIVVSHRASNEASKHANQKHGFIFMRSHEKTWVDGVTEDEVYYELLLDA